VKRPTKKQVKEAVNILVADFLHGSKKAVTDAVRLQNCDGNNLLTRVITGVFDPVPLGTTGYWLRKPVLFKVEEREYLEPKQR
jgi:hypothetical protein